jgi:hypothetical protein
MPAILTRRVTTDRGGTIVELGQALLRGDRSRQLLIRHVADPDPAPPDDATFPVAEPAAIPLRLDAPTVAGQLAPTIAPARPRTRITRRDRPR